MATVEQIQKSATAAAQSLIASDAKTTSMWWLPSTKITCLRHVLTKIRSGWEAAPGNEGARGTSPQRRDTDSARVR